MHTALVISFSSIKHDARVKRQILFLKNSLEVHVAGYDQLNRLQIHPPHLSFINKIISGIYLIFRFYHKAYALLYGQQINFKNDFDLIIANDIEALPLAFQYRGNAKIIFDAHEYAPRHFENKLSWRVFFQGFNKFLCAKYIPMVDGMITIGEGIAKEYEKHYNVKPVIITNAPAYCNIQPKKTDPKKIKLVHQGIANPSRKLELMIEMMDYLDDRFYLDLMLMKPIHRSNMIYLEKLKKIASKKERVRFIPPVSTEELIPTLNQYDIGIVLIPPINFNYKNTLPNKFFECIQARIALAIAPIPELKKITEKYNLGVVSEDFTAKRLAHKLNALSAEEIDHFKKNTSTAAQELNAEKNEVIFNDLVRKVLG